MDKTMNKPFNTQKVVENTLERLDSTSECILIVGFLMFFVILVSEIIDSLHYYKLIKKSKRWKRASVTTTLYNYGKVNGPETWCIKFPKSTGLKQSPINIQTNSAILVHNPTPLKWSDNYSKPPDYLKIHNSGHTICLYPEWYDESSVTISGGPLESNCNYNLLCIVFRWNNESHCHHSTAGSEHRIDNVGYAMEMQMFFVKQNCDVVFPKADNNNNKALDNERLAIISCFFENSLEDNPFLEHFTVGIRRVRTSGETRFLRPFPLQWLMPPFQSNYYSYVGSISYPPCTEGVLWIINPKPVNISHAQLSKFFRIYGNDSKLLKNNCRPIQPINNHVIFFFE